MVCMLHDHVAGDAELGVGEFLVGDVFGFHGIEDLVMASMASAVVSRRVSRSRGSAIEAVRAEDAGDAASTRSVFGADVFAEAGVDAGGEDLAGEEAGNFSSLRME